MADDEPKIMQFEELRKHAIRQSFGDKAQQVEDLHVELAKAGLDAYNYKVKQQAPIFAKRNEILKTIPGFWLQAMTNDSQFNPYIDSADRPALQHLTDFELKHDASDPRIVSFTFHFGADNPYFSDRTLTKSFTLAPDLDPSTALYDVDAPVISTPVAINWTSPDHDLVKKKPRINLDEVEEYDENFDIDGSVGSFFNFFSEEKDTVGIHEALLELHAVAVEAYAGVAHDEEISEDEDEEDEEDDDPNAVVDLEEDSDEGKAKKRQRQR